MPRKKSDKAEEPKKERKHRGEERAKKVTIEDVPQIVIDLPDEAMQRAALALATCGYRKNSNRRNGAVNYAARQANVSRQTIYDWLEKPEFEAAIQEVNSMLIAECFAGLRLCILRADAKGIVEFLAQLDPELDRTWLRERERQAHEERMLRLKIELADKTKGFDELPEPDFTFEETGPNERRVDDDGKLH